jgi:hypothetical protein
MKRIATIGIAALLLATGTAHADATLPLTDPLIGHWCRADDGVYKRGIWTCDGNLLVTQEGYSKTDDHCEFADVKRLSSKDGYAVKCESDSKRVELRIIDGELHYRDPDMVGCSSVGERMPDGFLNLRTGPGTRYAVKARLVTGDILRIPRFRANGENFTGWVSSRYVVDNGGSCHTP